MSSENTETVADIVTAMRGESHAGDECFLEWVGDKMRRYADRIEAAVKRERAFGAEDAQICGEIGEMIGREATCEKSSAVGNAAANHQFRDVAKMIPHEEVTVAEIQQPLQPATDCHGFGNAAEMREALEKIANMGEQIDYQLGSSDETVFAFRNERSLAHIISECARTALSAPPRNCDKYTLAEALRKYGFPTKSKPWGEKEWLDFCEYYISEAKRETDGSK